MTSCLTSEELKKLISPLAYRLRGPSIHLSIREVVTEILSCAQSFVPCEAGSLMMSHTEDPKTLIFVASFGAGADKLPGQILPPGTGIAGQVHLTGEPFLTNSPTDDNQFYQEIDKLTQHQTRSLLCVPLKAFGQSVGVLSLLNRVGDGFQEKDLDLLNIFCRYLTQSIQLMMEAKRQREASLRDHLTGLYNDRYLYGYLAEIIRTSLEDQLDIGLIFLDLDHFKSVVDTHGHLVGSQALREFGHLIGALAEDYEAVPARYGGDEYVLVIPRAERDKIALLAEDLRARIESAEITCEGEDGSRPVTLSQLITASVGVASLCQLETKGKSPENIRQHLIRVADMAMYEAKACGKNRVEWYHEGMLSSEPS